MWRLTFDMRGGRQMAKPAVGRPLDGRVRPRLCEQRPCIDFGRQSIATCATRAAWLALHRPGLWCCATAQDRKGSVRPDHLRLFGFETARPCAGRQRTDSPRRPERKAAQPSVLEAPAATCVWRGSTGQRNERQTRLNDEVQSAARQANTWSARGNLYSARERQQRNEGRACSHEEG